MDATVEFLLDNLKTLISHHIGLIQGASDELKLLQTELGKFNAILVEASKKYKKDEIFRAWESEIRETVYDIEDVIDKCVTQIAASQNSRMAWFKRLFSSTSRSLAEEVKDLREKKVMPLLQNVNFAKFADEDDSTAEAANFLRTKKSQHIVGFESETEHFIEVLNTDSGKMGIHSVVGMAGLGKTTLAYKIFEDERVNFEFPVRIWVNISANFNMRNVLVTILKKFTYAIPDASIEEDELIKTVRTKLGEDKFFMVMDDVWTLEAWKKICSFLPQKNKWARILVTTRNKFVADVVSKEKAHELRFLNQDESWELLQYEVYDNLNDVPQELVDVGRTIAAGCKGLPLSIVIIGGILKERKSKLRHKSDRMRSEWLNMSNSVNKQLTGDKLQILEHIISLSYQKLAYELRNCFLYLGVFPEDADIPVKKLIRLWIAEGFIKESGGDKSLEEVAHEKLEELINLNLLMVKESKPNGEAKICHMHDSVREICITEASYKKLNMFQAICMFEQGKFGPQENIENFRRVCIHSSSALLSFLSKSHKLPKARSFMYFGESATKLGPKQMAFIDGFGLLRVYDAKKITFPIFPKIKQLLHLRYLTLVLDKCDDLPEMICDLWNLQTITVDLMLTHEIQIKADIWKLRHLRHFQTKASITFKWGGKAGAGGEHLQTIGRMSPVSCTNEFFSKAKNLTTLGIRGDLNKLEMRAEGLGKLNRLNKLKLVHAVAAENPLGILPDYQCFPRNLKTLVLVSTKLDWTKMKVLSAIPHLEVLKLKDDAFTGHAWEAVGGGFHHLIRLHIEKATELRTWISLVSDPFPALKYLYINKCERLVGVPSVLGNKLEVLNIQRARESIFSAKNIVAEQKILGRTVDLQIAATDISSN